MNENTPSPTPPPLPGTPRQPAAPIKEQAFIEKPLPAGIHPFAVVDAVLKRPGRLFHELRDGRSLAVAGSLLLVTLVCLGIYGMVVGSMSGGSQLWTAPVKVALGMAAAALICLPSLYIFLCLGGVDARLREVTGALLTMLCLTALLLLGLAPVAWVFSQSTDSVALMSNLHLIFWLIGLSLGTRLLMRSMQGKGSLSNVRVWILIFCVVSLQMMTSLRPIIGTSDSFLPQEKKFFLAHWFEMMGGRM